MSTAGMPKGTNDRVRRGWQKRRSTMACWRLCDRWITGLDRLRADSDDANVDRFAVMERDRAAFPCAFWRERRASPNDGGRRARCHLVLLSQAQSALGSGKVKLAADDACSIKIAIVLVRPAISLSKVSEMLWASVSESDSSYPLSTSRRSVPLRTHQSGITAALACGMLDCRVGCGSLDRV